MSKYLKIRQELIMKHIFVACLTILCSCSSVLVHAQSEKALLNKGNELYKEGKFGEAEINYRKSINKDDKSDLEVAAFNLGDALYQQERYEEAAQQFVLASGDLQSREDKAKAFHNLGNSYLKAGELNECIEAYKNALRNNPLDEETKHNLSYAKNLKKQQQQQEQQQQDQQNQENQEQNEENKEQQQQDQQNQEQQQQDQQDKQSDEEKKEEQEQQQQDQQKQSEQGDKKEEQQQQQKQGEQNEEQPPPDQQQMQQQEARQLTKEEAARLLEALKNEELKVQQK